MSLFTGTYSNREEEFSYYSKNILLTPVSLFSTQLSSPSSVKEKFLKNLEVLRHRSTQNYTTN